MAFSSTERQDLVKPYADLLVITLLVSSFRSRRIMVYIGNSVDVLFWDAFQRMGIDKGRLKVVKTSLVGLSGHRVEPMNTLTIREEPRCARVATNLLVVDCETS